jgi:hypothetical protein
LTKTHWKGLEDAHLAHIATYREALADQHKERSMLVQGLARNYDLSTEPSKKFCNLLLEFLEKNEIRSSTLQSNFRKALVWIHDAEDEARNLWCPIVRWQVFRSTQSSIKVRTSSVTRGSPFVTLFLPRHQGCRSLFLSVTRTPIRCF